jgi:hypothetical protein
MEPFAVSVMPVAKPDEWQAFKEEITTGERADAHRQFLRRLGVKREHVHYQPTPMGDLMVLVWEGVDQDRLPALFADLLQNPQSEHERHLVEHHIPEVHGIDVDAGPPPEMKRVATIET